MIYTVTFNPSIDYVVDVENFKYGSVNRATKETIYPGGKGINVSIVLKNLGIESTALGFLAGFTGKRIQELLSERGINTDFIHVKEGLSRINVKLRSDCESEINGIGPSISKAEVQMLYDRLGALKESDMLVLAGSIPDSLPESMYMDIMEFLKEKKLCIAVDATKKLLMNVLDYHPFLIKPNNHELGEIFGVEIRTRKEAVPYAQKLREMGARNVLVSMAGEGAVLVTESGKVFMAGAPAGKVVNSVGAGDSMVAGFLAGYIESGDEYKAFITGLCTGSASAFSDGLATKEEVLKLMTQMSYT